MLEIDTPHGIVALIFIFAVILVAIKVAKWPKWPLFKKGHFFKKRIGHKLTFVLAGQKI